MGHKEGSHVDSDGIEPSSGLYGVFDTQNSKFCDKSPVLVGSHGIEPWHRFYKNRVLPLNDKPNRY